jgi:hypothetical protein
MTNHEWILKYTEDMKKDALGNKRCYPGDMLGMALIIELLLTAQALGNLKEFLQDEKKAK